jgi:hypothetical protein
MTDHRFCLHTATRGGRAECRRFGSPAGYHYAVEQTLIREAPCSDCFWHAVEYAEGIIREANPEAPEHALRAMTYTLARELMYDRNAISACTAHSHLCD